LASVFCCFSAPRWLPRADGRHGRATGAQGQHPVRTPFTPGPRRTHGGTAAAKGRHGTERGRREAGYPRHPSGTLMEVRSPWRTTVPPPAWRFHRAISGLRWLRVCMYCRALPSSAPAPAGFPVAAAPCGPPMPRAWRPALSCGPATSFPADHGGYTEHQ
jgi:hypothetical protein